MSTIKKAHKIAKKAHKGQFRKKSGLPYITHPEEVADIAVNKILPDWKEHFEIFTTKDYEEVQETIHQIALLHDVVEDSDVTLDVLKDAGFSETVVHVVDLLTKTNDDYLGYVKRILYDKEPYGAIVKIADITHNSSTQTNRDKLHKYAMAKFVLEGWGK